MYRLGGGEGVKGSRISNNIDRVLLNSYSFKRGLLVFLVCNTFIHKQPNVKKQQD